jgi:hypothetical protein
MPYNYLGEGHFVQQQGLDFAQDLCIFEEEQEICVARMDELVGVPNIDFYAFF